MSQFQRSLDAESQKARSQQNAQSHAYRETTDQERCANCPRRTFLGRVLARRTLGSEYIAPDCDATRIVTDGDLRNHLYAQGLVSEPYGVMLSPSQMETLRSGGSITSFGGTPRIPAIIRFGFNNQVCSQDVPHDYQGDFQAYVTTTTEGQTKEITPDD